MLEDSKKENVDEENNYEVNDSGEYYFPKSCYTCKTRFFKRHEFYDRVIFLFIAIHHANSYRTKSFVHLAQN